ncbi:MAG: hypothetical protein ABIR80_09175, partial [Opitutaceae bacterium]
AREAVGRATGAEALAQARYELGKALARADQSAEALTEFLWCFDEGMVRMPGLETRASSVLYDIRELGGRYPPAKAALIEHRDRAEATVQASQMPVGTPAYDVIILNDALGESSRSLALYDRLPPANRFRAALGRQLFAQFLAVKRYDDAAQAQPYPAMLQRWAAKQKADSDDSPGVQPLLHNANVHWLAERLEALAGAHRLDEARALRTIALAYDETRGARALYRTALDRAGHPEMLADQP